MIRLRCILVVLLLCFTCVASHKSAIGQESQETKQDGQKKAAQDSEAKDEEKVTEYVPFYLTYQMNGIYYFYCGADCAATSPTMQSASRMHLLGCENNEPRDAIETTEFKFLNFDGQKGKTALLAKANTMLASEKDNGLAKGIDKHALPRKGKKGRRRGSDNKIIPGGTVFLTNPDSEVIYDLEYQYGVGNKARFFRVIGVKSTGHPAEFDDIALTFFAQEIVHAKTPEEIKSHTFNDSTVGTITVDIPEHEEDPDEYPAIEDKEIHALAAEPIPPDGQ